MNILRKFSKIQENTDNSMNLQKQCTEKQEVQKREIITKVIEILKLKNTLNEMNNAIEFFKNRFKQAEERVCKLEDRYLDIIQLEEKKKIGMKKIQKSLCELRDTITQNNIGITGVPDRRERRKDRKLL